MALEKTFALPVMLLLGCVAAGDSASPTRSDSLGVSVLEYENDFAAASGSQWLLDTVPLFAVGDSTPELFQVRTAKFLSDGQFVVADGGSRELLVFDELGQLVARAGGEGEGPGEFRELTFVSVGPADSLFAYDGRARALSVFDRRGQFSRSVSLRAADSIGSIEQVGVVSSGTPIGAVRTRTPGPGLVRDSIILITFGSSGELEARLGAFPHMYTHWGPHPSPDGGGLMEAPLPVAFSSLVSLATAASVMITLPEDYSVIRLDLDGTRRITRQRQAPAALTESDLDQLFATLPGAPQELAVLRGLKGPTTRPAFGFEPLTARVGQEALLVTDIGETWVKAFELPDDSAPAMWYRVDSEGLYQGTVVMPAGCRATSVREDVVLAVCRDSNEIEHVRGYRFN